MKYKAYATGCRYCDNWGPQEGCWPCVRSHPARLARKVAMEVVWAFRRWTR